MSVAHAFYAAIPDHVRRAAHGQSWDLAGPRYEIDGDGLRLDGPMRGPLGRLFLRTAQYVLGPKWTPPWEGPVAADDERWARIVSRAATLVREKWRASLTVVMWDFGAPRGRRLGKMLRDRGLDVVFVGDLVPRGAIRFIPGDGHPAGSTNVLLARALADKVFPGTTLPVRSTPSLAAAAGGLP